MLEEQYLDKTRHERENFCSNVPDLDEYLRKYALQQSKKGVSVVRVIIDTDQPEQILGYYSLSAAQVDVAELETNIQKKLPCYPIPCFRIGRLAVIREFQGQGLGRLLIGCAVTRCLEARNNVAAYALIVDAINTNAADFYRHFGFTPFKSDPLKLYYPLGT